MLVAVTEQLAEAKQNKRNPPENVFFHFKNTNEKCLSATTDDSIHIRFVPLKW